MATLVEYIRNRQRERDALKGDPAEIKEHWVQELEKLMRKIDKWLEPAKVEGLKVTPESLHIGEERLEFYDAPARTIQFGPRTVTVEPHARITLGGYGLVHIKGNLGTFSLVFSEAEGWQVCGERDWANRQPLTRKRFERVLEALLG